MLVTFYNSFHTLRMDLGMLSEYVGLEHFREILSSDDVFWKAARNSLVWGVVAPIIDIPLAFVLALTLYARVNKSTKWVDLTAQQVRLLMKPGVWDTYVAAVNQGLPNKLIGADEALAKLEEARLKGK